MYNTNSKKTMEYERVLQKAMLVFIYDCLIEQIQIIEQTRLVEKREASKKGVIDERLEKVSQRSISIELKGNGSPNWLNNIFSEYKDIRLSNFLRLISLIHSKYDTLLMLNNFSFETLIPENSFEFAKIINDFPNEYCNDDFSFDDFFSGYSEEITDKLYDCLVKLSKSTYLSKSEILITKEILKHLDSE